jgi:HEAT repeat protein
MNVIRIILFAGIWVALSSRTAFSKQAPPPKYDETILKQAFNEFIGALDLLTVTKDYPKAIRKLLSGDPDKQIEAVKTLAETGEPEVIPWLLPFLEADNDRLRIWTGSSLEKLVSSYVLKRRDNTIGEVVVIKPLRPTDKDLRPLAWVVLKMFRKPDDGSTRAYAASMARYLGLYEFERELKHCLKSKHPAVSNKAKWALESLERQREYEKRTSNKPDGADGK